MARRGRPYQGFDSIIDRAEWQGDCLVWSGAKTTGGYGIVHWQGRPVMTHRWVYSVTVRDPGSLYVLHSCDNPPCMNPEHLRAGTALDNGRDAAERHRHPDRRGKKVGGNRSGPAGAWTKTWGNARDRSNDRGIKYKP